jgi:hypothetical protein
MNHSCPEMLLCGEAEKDIRLQEAVADNYSRSLRVIEADDCA